MKSFLSKMGMKRRRIVLRIIYTLFMLAFCFLFIYPVVWTVFSSFKKVAQLYSESPINLIPDPFTAENYKRVFTVLPFGRYLVNSFFLSTAIPFTMLFFSSITAFSLARLRFKGRTAIFILFLSTMIIPSHVILIPNYIIVSKMGLIDSYLALFLHSVFTGANVFGIFFFRQFFMSVPRELEDAAIIDGCSWYRVYFNIVMPNAKPAIATVAILNFRSIWNSFIWPMLVLKDQNKHTITVGLNYLQESVNVNLGTLLAGATVSVIPILVVYFAFQKYFVNTTYSSGFGGT